MNDELYYYDIESAGNSFRDHYKNVKYNKEYYDDLFKGIQPQKEYNGWYDKISWDFSSLYPSSINPSVSVDEKATIAAFKLDEFVNKLIKNINERNDNIIRGNRIFGPAYVTGEFINFTERFSIKDGYVDAVVKNMLIPVIKSKADNTVGTIDLSVYFNGDKQDIPSKLEHKLNNAIYNYILRHAIYTEE